MKSATLPCGFTRRLTLQLFNQLTVRMEWYQRLLPCDLTWRLTPFLSARGCCRLSLASLWGSFKTLMFPLLAMALAILAFTRPLPLMVIPCDASRLVTMELNLTGKANQPNSRKTKSREKNGARREGAAEAKG